MPSHNLYVQSVVQSIDAWQACILASSSAKIMVVKGEPERWP